MNSTAVKVCGVTRLTDLQWLNDSGVDYIGFVFVAGSKRQVTAGQVAEMLRQVDPNVSTVGVFMNQPMDWVAEVMTKTRLDIAQLHGEETLADIASLPCPVVKRLHPTQWLTAADEHQSLPENLQHWLLDPGAGTGEAFAWNEEILQGRDLSNCWLAGGLRVDNVKEHVALLNPKVVDVSSGAENGRPGIKDPELVRNFIFSVNGG